MRKILKRSNTIHLSSKNLDNIFYCLKKGASFEEVKDNFLFEIENNPELLLYNIKVPNHQKYVHFNNDFESFKDLYFYMDRNKKDSLIIPFLGADLMKKDKRKGR